MPMTDTRISGEEPVAACSFCGKSTEEIKQLIAGPAVGICNECVDLCHTLMHEGETVTLTTEDAIALRNAYEGRT